MVIPKEDVDCPNIRMFLMLPKLLAWFIDKKTELVFLYYLMNDLPFYAGVRPIFI